MGGLALVSLSIRIDRFQIWYNANLQCAGKLCFSDLVLWYLWVAVESIVLIQSPRPGGWWAFKNWMVLHLILKRKWEEKLVVACRFWFEYFALQRRCTLWSLWVPTYWDITDSYSLIFVASLRTLPVPQISDGVKIDRLLQPSINSTFRWRLRVGRDGGRKLIYDYKNWDCGGF